MLAYLLQVILFQLVFLLAYEILLKKETFFSYNRWYLILSPVFALLLPFLKFQLLSDAVPVNSFQALETIWLQEVRIGETTSQVTSKGATISTNPLNWWVVLYFVGFGISIFSLAVKFKKLFKLSAQANVERLYNLKIYTIPNSSIACTFFNRIFIGDLISEKDREQIMVHEMVHIKQKHSLDLIFFEIFKVLFWFNPLIYIYQNKLAALHEFIADEKAVKVSGKNQYYEQLLNTAFGTHQISFINQFFNHSLIKKRIIMLQKNKSKAISKFKYLILIPLMMVMLTYVACSEEQPAIEEQETDVSVVDKIAELKAFIENKDSLTKEEKEQFLELLKAREELLNKEQKAMGNEIIEIVEEPGNVFNYKKTPVAVPFAIIEEVPIFPGCEELTGNEARKTCMSEKITQFVTKNFDTSIGKEVGLEGTNRVIVQFRIDENGNIQDVRSRAAAPELEDEAERVINSIPQMEPGKHKGKATSVMYALPIAFKVNG